MARKRLLAKEAGLCTRCCKAKPRAGFLICAPCKAFTIGCRRSQRRAAREDEHKKQLADVHERAGDVARKHNFHTAAAEHYQNALELPNLASTNQIRLLEKLAEALWLGKDPLAATTLYERLLRIYRLHPERGEQAVNILLKQSNQMWLYSKTEAKLPLIDQAIRISEDLHNVQLRNRAILRKVNTLTQLGRHIEALECINSMNQPESEGERTWYWSQLGGIKASLGCEEESFTAFERAVGAIKGDRDPYRPTAIWADYANAALQFGCTKLANECCERALLHARRSNVAWIIPRVCILYAEVLMRIGRPIDGRDYVLEALSIDARAPAVDAGVAYVGIPLALQVKDMGMLAKCTLPAVIDQAFVNGTPARIGYVSAAFARLYVEQGQPRKARRLLHRAVQAMSSVENVWHLPLEVARSGALADIPKARALLEARLCLPRSQVAAAFLRLFDAFIAGREGRVAECHVAALDAALQFEQFQWKMYSDLARSLLPAGHRDQLVTLGSTEWKPFSDAGLALTSREREVATLILKGFGNRAISQSLSITENTVEKHVASVMHKIGVRSRHQLKEVLRIP